MKRSKFTEPQIAFILRQAEEDTAVGEVCRKAGISEADLLQLAQEVRRLGAIRDEAIAPARGRTAWRMDRTCFGRSGGFAPINLPLFQAVCWGGFSQSCMVILPRY
jgi:putative transposase